MTIAQRIASLIAATFAVGVIMFPVAAQAAQMIG
jgi:hypothetical protein